MGATYLTHFHEVHAQSVTIILISIVGVYAVYTDLLSACWFDSFEREPQTGRKPVPTLLSIQSVLGFEPYARQLDRRRRDSVNPNGWVT